MCSVVVCSAVYLHKESSLAVASRGESELESEASLVCCGAGCPVSSIGIGPCRYCFRLVWFGLSSLAAMEILVNFEYFPHFTPPPTQPPALNLYKYDEGSQHVLLFVLFAASAVAATKFIHNGFFTALQPLLQHPSPSSPPSSHALAGYIVYINFAFLRKLKFIMAQRSNL